MSANHPEVVADLISNLPSSEVAILFLGLLLFNGNLPVEVGVDNYFLRAVAVSASRVSKFG